MDDWKTSFLLGSNSPKSLENHQDLESSVQILGGENLHHETTETCEQLDKKEVLENGPLENSSVIYPF